MTKISVKDFCTALQDMLQTDCALDSTTLFSTVEEWDSVSFMVVIAYFDKTLGRRITFDHLSKCRTVADLIDLAEGDIA